MTRAGAGHDPRSVVTPDAFEVSKQLLGLRLASPGRRLGAMFVDLAVIAVITAVTRNFALILGVLAAALFIRAGFKHTPLRGSVFGRAMRGSVGCLGVFIGIVTAVVWLSVGIGGGSSESDGASDASGFSPGAVEVVGAVATAVVEQAYRQARTLGEAEEATRDFIEASEELGLAPENVRAVLVAAVPADAAWADDAPAMFGRLLPVDRVEPVEPRDGGAVRDEVSLYTMEEAVEAYGALLRSGQMGELDALRRAALEARLAGEIAADTLRVLERRIASLAGEVDSARGDVLDARSELEALETRGFFGTFRSLLDELGFGFGWATLYFTVILSWWKGQTLGKRLLGIRVVRLDGEPITWWVAFERAGGYAAGLATGLLGFAQVLWDSNRQAIHDRIIGTVVTIDPPEKVIDWEGSL